MVAFLKVHLVVLVHQKRAVEGFARARHRPVPEHDGAVVERVGRENCAQATAKGQQEYFESHGYPGKIGLRRNSGGLLRLKLFRKPLERHASLRGRQMSMTF